MKTDILTAVDCPEFFLDYNPSGWFEMIYDDEKVFMTNRIYVDSLNEISLNNWISLSRRFITTAKLPRGVTLH